jgi:predicted nucleic acid-binding protein
VRRAAVSDAGPLIHLAEIRSLDVLGSFETLLVPETVYDEVETGGIPTGLADLSYELVDADHRSVETDELDPGERAALAVATARDAILLTDDLAARDVGTDMGVEVRGSIGVLALGYARGVLDKEEAVSRMRALHRETSLFVSEAVVERGIRMLDEQ